MIVIYNKIDCRDYILLTPNNRKMDRLLKASNTIFCYGNLNILQSINYDCADLIYIDSPFNKKKAFTAPNS